MLHMLLDKCTSHDQGRGGMPSTLPAYVEEADEASAQEAERKLQLALSDVRGTNVRVVAGLDAKSGHPPTPRVHMQGAFSWSSKLHGHNGIDEGDDDSDDRDHDDDYDDDDDEVDGENEGKGKAAGRDEDSWKASTRGE